MGQMETLIREVSRQVGETAVKVEIYLRRVEELASEHVEMRERLVELETGSRIDVKHGEEEHERLRRRLGEGDEEFKKIQAKAAAAVASAESAVRRIDELKKALERETKVERKGWDWRKVGAEVLVAVVVMAFGWIAQHLYFLAKLAEAAQAAKGGHP